MRPDQRHAYLPGGTASALVAASVLASLALGALVASLELSIDAVLVVAIFAVVAAPIVSRVAAGRFDIFEPITIMSATYAVLFVFRPAYILLNDVSTYTISGEVVEFREGLTQMLVAALIGAVAMIAAYEFRGSGKNRRGAAAGRESAFETKALKIGTGGILTLVFAAGATFLYILTVPGGFSGILAGRSGGFLETATATSGYLYHAPTFLIPASLLLMIAWYFSRKYSYLALSVFAALFLVAVRGPVGGRLTLVPLFAGAILFFYLYRDRRPRPATIVAVLLVGLIVWSAMLEIRNEETRSDRGLVRPFVSLVTNPERAIEPFTEGQDAGMAPGLAAAMTRIPDQLPYTYGATTLGDVAIRFVPRALWPEKPLAPREQLTRELWPASFASNVANPEYSILQPFFRDFGLLGILVGMAVYGLLMSKASSFWQSRRLNPLITLGYAILLANIPMTLRDSPTDSLVRLSFAIVPIVLVYFYATREIDPAVARKAEPEPGASKA